MASGLSLKLSKFGAPRWRPVTPGTWPRRKRPRKVKRARPTTADFNKAKAGVRRDLYEEHGHHAAKQQIARWQSFMKQLDANQYEVVR